MRYLGKDLEVRFTQERKKLTVMRMPCNQYPIRKEETFWWRMTIWGNEFDKFISYLTDKNGVFQVSLRIIAYRLSFPSFGKFEESPLEKSFFLSKGFDDGGGNTFLGLYDAKMKLKHLFSEFYLIKFFKGVSKRLAKIFAKIVIFFSMKRSNLRISSRSTFDRGKCFEYQESINVGVYLDL